MAAEDNPADEISEADYWQGYIDAHPGNPDCEYCGGRGSVFDELTGGSPVCPHCLADGWVDEQGNKRTSS